jgi:2-polyprenyl-6-methoxyphenol hydroxylase-like FAD-dependent oxidoreductase
MTGRAMPMRIGDVELLVETVPAVGSEPTAGLDQARDRVLDAYERAQAAIVAVASSTVDTIGELTARNARPDQIEMEFGLKFSAQGGIIVAGASGEATLTVRLSYLAPRDGNPAGPARRDGGPGDPAPPTAAPPAAG